MSEAMPLLFHMSSYLFSYSPILTKNSEVQNELRRLIQKGLSQENPIDRK
jgi:hypothetical protein